MRKRKIKIDGQRFGRLIVIGETEPDRRSDGKTVRRLTAICNCGSQVAVRIHHLISGHTTSCGCAMHRKPGSRITHGETLGKQTAEYTCWAGMVSRCENPRVERYPRYGGRGITICARWRYGENGKSGYECFLADMGRKPTPKHSIDRIDNDGNYESSNCRWATRSEQRRNQQKKSPTPSSRQDVGL